MTLRPAPALPADHRPVAAPRVGVLLINLGSPDAPTTKAVRRYLREFLSDRRVVEIPPIIWQIILNFFVLTTRPAKSAHAYQQVWTDQGSPLTAITRAQSAALAERMSESVIVDWAMRYGNPSIESRLTSLRDQGCDRILIAPLYPQYSGATTGTALDAVWSALSKMRWQPAIRTLPPYHDAPAHIAALKASTETSLATLDFTPDVLLASFHSMPERTLMLGDPYHCQCRKTARLLAQALGKPLEVSFQSKLGRAKWLEPATEATLIKLAQSGTKRIAVMTPGFSADNLETLEEIAIRGKEAFIGAGGTHFAALPCLNASPPGMDMLHSLIGAELAGWV